MESPQRHREHGVRIKKEKINCRNGHPKTFFKSELRLLCVFGVIPSPPWPPSPSVTSHPSISVFPILLHPSSPSALSLSLSFSIFGRSRPLAVEK